MIWCTRKESVEGCVGRPVGSLIATTTSTRCYHHRCYHHYHYHYHSLTISTTTTTINDSVADYDYDHDHDYDHDCDCVAALTRRCCSPRDPSELRDRSALHPTTITTNDDDEYDM